MLNPSYKLPEKPKFDPLPEDMYQVVIEDINLVQQPKFNKPDEEEEVLDFKFLVLDEEFLGRRLWKKIRPVMSSGSDKGQASWLYEIYRSASKDEPDAAQMYGLTADELNSLVGKQVRLSVKQKVSKKGNVNNAIDGILPVKKELPVPSLETKSPETPIPVID